MNLALADLERHDPGAPAGGRRERRFCCPLPECADKPIDRAHRALAVNTSTGAWQCHRCGGSGKLTDFWTDRTDRPRSSVPVALAAFTLPPRKSATPTPVDPDAWDWRSAWDAARPLIECPAGVEYVESRGIPVETAAAAGVRFAPDWTAGERGRPGPAVLCPLSDRAGAVVAVAARYIDNRDGNKRTSGAKSMGVFSARPGALSARVVAVVEGQFDALALAAAGVATVALIGTSWPEWLPVRLAFRHVIIGTDADDAGDRCAVELDAALSRLGARTVRMAPRRHKDWSEYLSAVGLPAHRAQWRGFADLAAWVHDPPSWDVPDLASMPVPDLESMPVPDLESMPVPDLAALDVPREYWGTDLPALTADDVRYTEARRLTRAGRLDLARFLLGTLSDQTTVKTLEEQIEALHVETEERAAIAAETEQL
jgi:hypothetical protein